MLLKIRREVFTPGEFEIHHEFKLTSRKAICNKYHLSLESTEFYDSTGSLIIGNKIKDTAVIAVQKPAGETVALVLSIVSLVAAAVGATVGVVSAIRARRLQQELANRKSVAASYSYTVRGSTNQARNSLPVGVLLGRCNVCGDVAGLPYSSYDESSYDQDQYIHQLFCYGYSWDGETKHGGVVLEKDSSFVSTGNPNGYKIHIGDSPLDLYKDFWVDAREGIDDLDDMTHAPASIQTVGPLFNKRVIEEAVTTKLTDEYIERSTATNTTKIGVGVIAPYGYYKANSNGSRGNQACDYEVQYKAHSASAWTTVYRRTAALAVPVYRHMVVIDNLAPGQYDVRVVNHLYTTSVSADVVDTLEWDVLQSWTRGAGSAKPDAPVRNTDRYSMLAVKIRATDQINGYLDKLYTKAHLICRTYTGDYTETSNFENYWTIPNNAAEEVGTMNNPASILLYLLTDPKVNPRPIPSDKIDWVSLREWFQFCADPDRNWSCNAWITEQITVGELAQKVCAAGRAMLTLNNGLYGVSIENSTDVVSQIFTPRNAWNMQEVKSYEDQVEMIDASFVNEDTEVQENIYVIYDKENEEFIYKTDSAEIVTGQYKSESVALWGVTNPHQAQQLATYNLCYSNFLSRTYTWECGLESIISSVGDVVYLANDMFLFSLGYGRIKAAIHADGGSVYTGVVIDSDVALDPTKNYGITVREEDGTITHHPINQDPEHPDSRVLEFVTPISDAVDVLTGNLFIYGDSSEQGKKVKITEIKPGENRTATITAVDYVPAVYTSDATHTIPPYVSNVSKYGSGATFNAGNTRPEVQPQVYAESAVIQYAIGASGDDHSDIAESDWSDVQIPPTFEKSYLWMRTRNSSADAWSYSCINSAQSALEAFTVTPQYVISSSDTEITDVAILHTYFATEDEQPLLGKDYFTRYEVYDYVETSDEEPQQGITYYVYNPLTQEYEQADVSQGFIEGVTYYIRITNYEYELADDYTGFPTGFYERTSDYDWKADALDWHKGWYVWKRNYIEYASGYSFYTEPYYDVEYTQSLLQSCRFEIFSDGFTYDVNKRASASDYSVIMAKVFMKGYGSVVLSDLVWDYPESITLNYSGDICYIYIPKNTNLETITINISYEYKTGLTDETHLVLNANNVTGQYAFLGNLNQLPTTASSESGENIGSLIEGDCCNLISSSSLTAYVYHNSSWIALGNSEIEEDVADVSEYPNQTNACCNGYLISGYKDKGLTFSIGDCYSFLFAQQANINKLASQQITLLNNGSIKSANYVYGEGGSFDLGIAGFYINAEGIAEFVSVRMKNSIIQGKFIHSALETVDPMIGSEVTATLDSTGYYKHNEAYNALKSALPINQTVNASITYKGVSYPKVHRADSIPVSSPVSISPWGSWTNNTGNVVKVNQVLAGAVYPDAGAIIPVGGTVQYAGWDISTLVSAITTKDSILNASGTYNSKAVTRVLNVDDLETPSGDPISYNVQSAVWSSSVSSLSGSYTFPATTKNQTITITAQQGSYYYKGKEDKYFYPVTVSVSLNGAIIINDIGETIWGVRGPSPKQVNVNVKAGDVLTYSFGSYKGEGGERDYYYASSLSFTFEQGNLFEQGFVSRGVYLFTTEWEYIGLTGVNTNRISLTSPVTFSGNNASFNYTGEYSVGINLCNSSGRLQRTIQADTYSMISSAEITAVYQGVNVLANLDKYYHPSAVLQDDEPAPVFDARQYDLTAPVDIHWFKLGVTNNPEIDETNIEQYQFYWNGSNMFQIFKDGEQVFVLTENDYVSSDFSLQFTPYGDLAHIRVKDIIPTEDLSHNIGKTNKRFSNLYVNTLHANFIDAPLSETLEDTDSFYIQHADGSIERLIKADMPSEISVALKGDKGNKGDKGDKGDTFTFEDLTPEQLDELRTGTATVFVRKYSYLVDAEVGDTSVTIPDQYYNPTADTLIVSVDGVMFAETRDYTKTSTGISLVNPVETDCTFEFQIFRSLTLHEEDYEYFKGDKGDQGAMSENDVKAYCQTYITSNLKGKVIKDVNRDVISLAGIYTYTIAGYVTSDNVKVFINGLLASVGVDYTLSNAGVVTSVNSQAVGTEFIVIRERTYFESEIGTSTTVNQSIVDLLNSRVQQAEAKATEAKQTAEALAPTKADIDLSNVTAPHIIDTWVSGTEWYRVWSDGWCEQGNTVYVGTSTTSANYTITFKKPFKDTNYFVELGQIHNRNGTGYWGSENYLDRTTTSTILHMSSSGFYGYYWKASGYLAQGEY